MKVSLPLVRVFRKTAFSLIVDTAVRLQNACVKGNESILQKIKPGLPFGESAVGKQARYLIVLQRMDVHRIRHP
jgi:hypothetical protein